MKQITIIIEDKLGTILSSKSLCDSSLEIIRNNDNELTVTIKSDEFLITDWRTDVLPSTPIELPIDEEIKKEMEFDWLDPDDVAYLGGAIWMRDKIQGGNK